MLNHPDYVVAISHFTVRGSEPLCLDWKVMLRHLRSPDLLSVTSMRNLLGQASYRLSDAFHKTLMVHDMMAAVAKVGFQPLEFIGLAFEKAVPRTAYMNDNALSTLCDVTAVAVLGQVLMTLLESNPLKIKADWPAFYYLDYMNDFLAVPWRPAHQAVMLEDVESPKCHNSIYMLLVMFLNAGRGSLFHLRYGKRHDPAMTFMARAIASLVHYSGLSLYVSQSIARQIEHLSPDEDTHNGMFYPRFFKGSNFESGIGFDRHYHNKAWKFYVGRAKAFVDQLRRVILSKPAFPACDAMSPDYPTFPPFPMHLETYSSRFGTLRAAMPPVASIEPSTRLPGLGGLLEDEDHEDGSGGLSLELSDLEDYLPVYAVIG